MRKTWVAAAAVMVSAGLLWAATGRPGVVRTRDGGTYDGMVDEREDGGVVVNVRGIDTTVAKDNVVSITYGDFEARWFEAYAKLGEKDAAGRVAAARQAFNERRYDLAEKACREAQAIDPNSVEAAELLRSTMSQRKLERNTPAENTAGTATPPATTPAVRPTGQWTMLTADDINRIKQLEFKESETRLRFGFANGVLKKFYDATPTINNTYPSFNAFRSAPPAMQAARIIRDGTKEMAKDVKVNTDPETIISFRRDAMPLVAQGCATSVCHGGNNAASAKFSMISPAADASAVYTNFYVLQSTTSKATGEVKEMANGTKMNPPAVAYMMDRIQPDQSLLLQYGLPDTQASMKHPKVKGYAGIYPRGRDDTKYQAVMAFIKTLNAVQPDYGITFTLQRKDAPGPSTRP